MPRFIKKLLEKIASMSKLSSAIYCIVLTMLFLGGIAVFLSGLLFIYPEVDSLPAHVIPCICSGAIVIFLVLLSVFLTAVASNYIEEEHEKEEEQN